MPAPVLTTPRLILRPATAADWPAYQALMASPRAQHMGGPFSPRTAWGMFCADHAQWDFYRVGALMIDARDSGVCLGQVGINSGPLFPEPELGWMLYPEAEGHGFAIEAAQAMRHWAERDRGLATLVSYVDPDNHRSRNLAERLGAILDPEAPRPEPTDLVYRHFGTATHARDGRG